MEQNEQLYKEIKNNARFTVECLSLNHEGQGVCNCLLYTSDAADD